MRYIYIYTSTNFQGPWGRYYTMVIHFTQKQLIIKISLHAFTTDSGLNGTVCSRNLLVINQHEIGLAEAKEKSWETGVPMVGERGKMFV